MLAILFIWVNTDAHLLLIVIPVLTKASAVKHLNRNHEGATKKLKSDMDDVQNQFSKVHLDEMKYEEKTTASLFSPSTSVILVKKEQPCYKQNLLQLSKINDIQKIAKNDPQVFRSLFGALHFNQQLINKRNSTLETKRKSFLSGLECTQTVSKNPHSVNAHSYIISNLLLIYRYYQTALVVANDTFC